MSPCQFYPAFVAIGSVLTAGHAAAEEFPAVTADFTAKLQYENGFGPDRAKPQSDFLFTDLEGGFSLDLSERLSIESVVLFEMVNDPLTGEDSTFEDHGLFTEELILAYHGGSWSAFTGKFNTAFGTGWDLGAGIWGVDFAEDYEVTEKIGFGGSKTFSGRDAGQHTLYGSLYRADRSVLSESLFNDRGRLRLDGGGTTNTKDPESYTLSLTGENVLAIDGLGYHIAYRSHAHGDTDFNTIREDGFVSAVFGTFALNGMDVNAMAEGAFIRNAEGTFEDLSYVTLGGTAYFAESWNIALSATFRTTHLPGGGNANDHRFQATTGYEFESGVTFDLGYRYSREDSANDHVLGFQMVYTFSL